MLTPEQLEARKNGIGGTDAGAIMGFSTFKSAFDVWLEKTGRTHDSTSKETHPWLYWGNKLESVVADEYSIITGEKLIESNTVFHPEHKWMVGHPDRLIVGKNKILECKTANQFTAKDDWGTGKDSVKLPYIIQVQHYMAITGADETDIAVLIGNSDFRIYTIPRDEKLIGMIIKECGDFYKNHILTDIPPQPLNGKEAAWIWKDDNGEYRNAINEEILLFNSYNLQRDSEAEAKKEKEKVGEKLKVLIEDYSSIEDNGYELVTYKKDKNGKRRISVKKMRK